MAGTKQSREKLNHTLEWIVKILNKHNIENWCVAYGTLLGLTRDGNCIDGDDDVDILIPLHQRKKFEKALKEEKINSSLSMGIPNADKIVFTRNNKGKTQIDFYYCKVDESGNYYDTWEKVLWSNCLDEESGKMPHILWNNIKVNVPNNYEKKLLRRYGSTWKERVQRGTEAGDGYRQVKIL